MRTAWGPSPRLAAVTPPPVCGLSAAVRVSAPDRTPLSGRLTLPLTTSFSDCSTAQAAPAGIIPRWLIGVQPVSPGFGTFQIKPQVANLTYAKAKVPTIRGPVWVSVQQNEQEYTLDVTVPANSVATVYVPHFTESDTVFFDDDDVRARVDGKFLVLDNVGSGDHSLVVQKN